MCDDNKQADESESDDSGPNRSLSLEVSARLLIRRDLIKTSRRYLSALLGTREQSKREFTPQRITLDPGEHENKSLVFELKCLQWRLLFRQRGIEMRKQKKKKHRVGWKTSLQLSEGEMFVRVVELSGLFIRLLFSPSILQPLNKHKNHIYEP